MTMSLKSQGFSDLECIAREFLWGKNELGEFWKPLVAWKDIALSKAKEGWALRTSSVQN